MTAMKPHGGVSRLWPNWPPRRDCVNEEGLRDVSRLIVLLQPAVVFDARESRDNGLEGDGRRLVHEVEEEVGKPYVGLNPKVCGKRAAPTGLHDSGIVADR